MEKKYFISFTFDDYKNMKRVPRSKKSWMNCSSPDEHLVDFKNMFEKSVKLVGEEFRGLISGFYTVYEETDNGLGDLVFKIVYSGNKGVKYFDLLQKVSEEFNF